MKGKDEPLEIEPHTTPPDEFVVRALVVLQLVILEIARAVVVALVEVLFEAVKFWRVEEPMASKFVVLALTALRVLVKKFVVVAEVPVAFTKVKFWRVLEPLTKRLVEEAVPKTSSLATGLVVPIPTFPA